MSEDERQEVVPGGREEADERREPALEELFVPMVPAPTEEELPRRFPNPFDSRGAHPLAARAVDALKAELAKSDWHGDGGESVEGKMFAVLVGQVPDGRIGYLRGFSGMLRGRWQIEGFVPPMFEVSAREPWWTAAQEKLRCWDEELRELTSGAEVIELEAQWAALRQKQDKNMQELRQRHRERRAARQRVRLEHVTGGGHPAIDPVMVDVTGGGHPAIDPVMVDVTGGGHPDVTGGGHPAEGGFSEIERALAQESRGDGAEKKRMEGEQRVERTAVERRRAEVERRRAEVGRIRGASSAGYQRRLHDLYWVRSASGEVRRLRELFAPGEPPSGAGDCAGPKLLAYALRVGFRPIALAEMWWGAPPLGGGRRHGQVYAACRGKCGPILPHMLMGIEIDEAPLFGSTGRTSATVTETTADGTGATAPSSMTVGRKRATVTETTADGTGATAPSSMTVDRTSTGETGEAAGGPITDAAVVRSQRMEGRADARSRLIDSISGDSLFSSAGAGALAERGSGDDLEIHYEDQWLVVIIKPCGLLSVPGRGAELEDSVLSRLRRRYPAATGALLVHRLDLDTSGLLMAAKDGETHATLQRRFLHREIEKRYVALLDGVVTEEQGVIELALRTDVEDRPRQIHDPIHGKAAMTHWRVLSREGERTRVEFSPRTGRTHQLRVHAAHQQGLGTPIVGDRLYGRPGPRLMLHAVALCFSHPRTGERLELRCDAPF